MVYRSAAERPVAGRLVLRPRAAAGAVGLAAFIVPYAIAVALELTNVENVHVTLHLAALFGGLFGIHAFIESRLTTATFAVDDQRRLRAQRRYVGAVLPEQIIDLREAAAVAVEVRSYDWYSKRSMAQRTETLRVPGLRMRDESFVRLYFESSEKNAAKVAAQLAQFLELPRDATDWASESKDRRELARQGGRAIRFVVGLASVMLVFVAFVLLFDVL